MKRIDLMRHGYSVGNLFNDVGLNVNAIDPPLTPLGYKQVIKASKYVSREKYDAIYSSTLVRAIQTAKIMKESLHLIPEIKTCSYINEIDLLDNPEIGDFLDILFNECGNHILVVSHHNYIIKFLSKFGITIDHVANAAIIRFWIYKK